MTLTIDLENDLYAAAEAIAKRDRSSIAAVVNHVLREALQPPAESRSVSLPPHISLDPRTAFPVVQCGRPFTSDDVARIEADLS